MLGKTGQGPRQCIDEIASEAGCRPILELPEIQVEANDGKTGI
jgi:hypothetical protein